jgi:hypothetical protein
LGQAVTAGWVRKRLHHAREKFTDLIVADVAQTVESSDQDALEQELLDVGLLDQCRAAVMRRFNKSS